MGILGGGYTPDTGGYVGSDTSDADIYDDPIEDDAPTWNYDTNEWEGDTSGHPNSSGSPIGSGTVDIDIDPDTGDANVTIEGPGGGEPVTEEMEDDVDVVDVPYTGGSTDDFQDEVERTEQAVENATGGAAYGDPETVDDIGSGSAVERYTELDEFVDDANAVVERAFNWLAAGGVVLVLALAAGVGIVFGGDDGSAR